MLHSSWMYRKLPSGGAHLDRGRPGVGQHRGELCLCTRGVVGVQRNVRLHALLGKKDGHTFTPNEEMKLDCRQDLSEMVLTRCRLLSVYVNIYVKCEFMCGKSPVPLVILLSFCTPRQRGQSRPGLTAILVSHSNTTDDRKHFGHNNQRQVGAKRPPTRHQVVSGVAPSKSC